MAKTRNIEKIKEKVEKKIHLASEIEDPFTFLVYGRPGTGKTRLLATMPDVLLVDVNDKGTRSTKRDLDPSVIRIEFWGDLDDIYWYLASGEHSFKSVAVDGVTGMSNLALKFVMGDEASRDASRDPEMPSRAVWGKTNEIVKTQIINFRNLPMHVGFSALERSRQIGEDDEQDVQIVVGPAVSPGVLSALEPAVGTIGHLTAQEVLVKKKGGDKKEAVIRRSLLVGPSERYITKVRDGIFGRVIRN